ncbi:MAG: helix-turn-helix transcriptional regulator [Oscillospiraceae bacterium]|nr:helix-turn-helix transcriptional regulator [Oscillospiraceae bacterium]
MTLGEKLRQARQNAGLTQKQVAGDRITRNMLSQIENDLAAPSMKTLAYLAETLGVSEGWLLTDESDGGALHGAREALCKGDAEEAYRLANKTPGGGDEKELLLCRAALAAAHKHILNAELSEARELALLALEHNEKTLYRSQENAEQALWIAARCEMESGEPADEMIERVREAYTQRGSEARYHMLTARYYLDRQQLDAAEREIWTITALSDRDRPAYLILRGRHAVQQEKYENALSFLRQAEALSVPDRGLRRTMYSLLETASRETEDYKAAYEYARKLRDA